MTSEQGTGIRFSAPPSSGVPPTSGVQEAKTEVRSTFRTPRPAVRQQIPAGVTPRAPLIHDDSSPEFTSPPSAPPRPKPPPATLDYALLRGALEEIPLGVATTRSGQILFANSALERIFGASAGELEQKHVSALFDRDAFFEISQILDEKRVFDGRVKTSGFDGRTIDAEVHVEWYSSESLGIGGFLIFRDLSLELSSLGKLLDQLGGVLFRIRVEDGALEYVSPSIAKLAGMDPETCVQHPVLVTNLVAPEERDRLAFLYKRVVSGELATATTQVNLRRPDGRMRMINIRATARRDTASTVRHIEGVLTDVSREAQEAAYMAHLEAAPTSTRAVSSRRVDPSAAAPALLELAQELLREASQHLHSLGRELKTLRRDLGEPTPSALSTDDAERLLGRTELMARSFAAVSSLNRRVRHALRGSGASAAFADVLEEVRATLGPVIGDEVITINAGDAGGAMIENRSDELNIALTHLALRAFRMAGSGTLQIEARRVSPPPPTAKTRPRLGTPTLDRMDTLLIITAGAPPDSSLHGAGISTDMLQTVPRRSENDQSLMAARTVLALCNADIETDDISLDEASTSIRIRSTG